MAVLCTFGLQVREARDTDSNLGGLASGHVAASLLQAMRTSWREVTVMHL